MARVFVSYSRKNKDFCQQLTNGLQKRDLDFWVDWDGIPPTVDWMKEIEKGIVEADCFLAIVTPDWIASSVCLEELKIAVKNGKRLIPVVPCDIPWSSVPETLAKRNFIFFTESFDFGQQLELLFTALNTDYDWLKIHRRLQVKALEWERANKENGFLLHGKDLEEAEQQLSVNATKNPNPTGLQREYVLKSRQEAERENRIRTGSLIAAVLVMSVIAAYLAVPRILDKIAQMRARGEMVLIPEGPSVFGAEGSFFVNDLGWPPLQSIPSLPTFRINKYEVSNYQYSLCVKYGDCTPPIDQIDFKKSEKAQYPVVNVTLFQANTYCQWLGQRLPNQFEWERAARGPQGFDWPWGNDQEPTPETANMRWKEYVPVGLEPVDSHPAGISPEGIYNLIGNAAEWTSSLSLAGVTSYEEMKFWDGNPETFNGNSTYIEKGGGWNIYVDEVGTFDPQRGTSALNDLGFRCAADVK